MSKSKRQPERIKQSDKHIDKDRWELGGEKIKESHSGRKIQKSERRQVKERYKEDAVTPVWLILAYTGTAPWTRANGPHPHLASTLSFSLSCTHTKHFLSHKCPYLHTPSLCCKQTHTQRCVKVGGLWYRICTYCFLHVLYMHISWGIQTTLLEWIL